ncbi:MAG: hypothetical protein FGM52_17245 [Mycobacterium sp.]|nr:hypothetical protein [Mycobacterium sp.]
MPIPRPGGPRQPRRQPPPPPRRRPPGRYRHPAVGPRWPRSSAGWRPARRLTAPTSRWRCATVPPPTWALTPRSPPRRGSVV